MKKITLILFLITSIGFAQNYTVDNTFNPTDLGIYSQFVGLHGRLLNNGKILTSEGVYRNTSSVHLNLKKSIYRLNSDGSIDNSFVKINFDNYSVSNFFADPGQGKFMTVSSDNTNTTLKYYDENGVPLSSFTSPIFIGTTLSGGQTQYNGGGINGIRFLNDGKFLIFGGFNLVNGVSYNNIVRLNANGTIDTSFVIGTGFSNYTTAIEIQADGKYLVVGKFSSYNGIAKGRIARLMSNGTLDASFNVYTAYNVFGISYGYSNLEINDIIIQPDGKIITAGPSMYQNGSVYRKDMERLNTDGSIDASFNYFMNSPDYVISSLLYDSDGSIYFKEGIRTRKCNKQGVLITSFNNGNNHGDTGNGAMLKQNNKIVVVGSYKNSQGISRLGYHRLNSDGSIDLTFNPSYGPNNIYYSDLTNTYEAKIYGYILPDNKILLYGDFTTYNDVPVKRIIRLHENGELDTSFNLDLLTLNFSLNDSNLLNIQTKKNYDGNIYIGGRFTSINGQVDRKIIKIKPNGTIDSNFIINSTLELFKIANDNKILTNVSYDSGNGTQYKIIRYNADTTLDNTYQSPQLSYPPLKIELLDNNKSLISFGQTGGVTAPFKTLDANGADIPINNSIYNHPPVYKTKSINNKIYCSAVSPDTYSGGIPLIFRYNSDWTLDLSFTQIETSNSIKYLLLSNERTVTQTPLQGQYEGTKTCRINNSSGIETSTISLPYETTTFLSQNCENIIVIGTFERVYNSTKNNIYRLTDPNISVIPSPTGAINQLFTNGKTLSDLIVNGQNLLWYNAQNECAFNTLNRNSNQINSLLPANTLLVNGTTYYASQIVNGVESNHRLPITVNLPLATQDFGYSNYFTLYPNPVMNVLNIKTNEDIEIKSINIYYAAPQKPYNN